MAQRRERVKNRLIGFSVSGAALLAGSALLATTMMASADDVRTGQAAYGDFHTDAPGVIRKITPADVNAPGQTESAANRSKTVAKPADATLKTMPGFKVEPFVTGMTGARRLRVAPNGDIFLSRSKPGGQIMVLRAKKGEAKPDEVSTFAEGLTDAYGMAFYPPGPNPQWLYVGATGKVVRYPYKNGDLKASGAPETVISDLKIGGGHWTRDIAFSGDGKTLYVAVGSGSNVAADMGEKPANMAAFEKTHAVGSTWGNVEEWRANILAYDPDGKNKRVYATGVRNCSSLTPQPGTGTLYCATNERDLLGDNTPPDYVSSIKEGGFYGWPWYYMGNHEDTRPGGGTRPDLAGKAIVPDVLIQPHSAPLGIAFNEGGQFPEAWKGDAFVALHGSWNRKLHTGYKIVRLPFKDGKPTGEYQDFVIGFTAGEENVWGRPVGVIFAPDGSLLFSEDGNGTVYRVTYSAK
jgi:glucose/arabinose dehydrogenase